MRDDLYQEALAHFNEPVLDGLKVVRLIGYGETAVDCYWILSPIQGEVYWSSACGGFMPLRSLKEQGIVTAKDGEKWSDYTRLDSWLELNGAPKVESFILEMRPEDNVSLV